MVERMSVDEIMQLLSRARVVSSDNSHVDD
jgi:hypothetical protein